MINEDGVEIEHGMVVYEPWKGGYYRKSEADKVIEHNKYKRCLAMAEWCKSKSEIYNEFAADAAEYMSSYEARFRRKAEHYEKWNNRWLKIAEKFKDKEAK